MGLMKHHPIELLVFGKPEPEPEDDERHIAGCVCADCSDAELTTEND